MQVKRFTIQKKRPRNKYPWGLLKRPGDGFIIASKDVPKGSLNGLARHLGWKLQIERQANGDVVVKLVSKGTHKS